MAAHKSGKLDGELYADGDGIISQEEWEAEWASRGDLAAAVTRKTTKHQLAVDYPGATIKNKLGPQSPVVLNTPFTAVTLPADPPPNPDSAIVAGVDNFGNVWGRVSPWGFATDWDPTLWPAEAEADYLARYYQALIPTCPADSSLSRLSRFLFLSFPSCFPAAAQG